MHKKLYMVILALAALHYFSATASIKQPLKKIKSFLTRNKPEKINQQELPTSHITSISIHNIDGSVSIKTGWKQKSLFLKTTVRTRKHNQLDNFNVIIDDSKEKHLTIATKTIDKKIPGSVEYELIVPASLDIALSIAGNGQALIKDVNGTINAITNDTITITNTKNNVSAQTLKKGTILIANTTGPVSAITKQGNIIADNIAHSFSAYSSSGKVAVTYAKLPATSTVDLETTVGNILLTLPANTNAEIQGHTARGTLVSDHYILPKPYPMQWNSMTWNKLKKEVNGTLGSGDAHIALRSAKGNVKIVETKII